MLLSNLARLISDHPALSARRDNRRHYCLEVTMGVFESMMPIPLDCLRRSSLRGFLLLLPVALSACSNTRDVYSSGPWGPPRPPDSAAALYSGPWGAAQYRPIAPSYPVRPSGFGPAPRASVELLEPIGPWAKRNTSPTQPNGEVTSNDYAHLPPAQTEAPAQQEQATAAPPAPASKPSTPKPAARSQDRRLTSLTGSWTAQTSGSAPCRLHLSSVAALDLYKASTAQCGNQALQNVNAWSLRNGEIVLYARGSVVLRARGEGETLHGALEGTSTLVKLSR